MTDNLTDKTADPKAPEFKADESILTLFNLIPDPAIIYDPGMDRVLAANNALFLLTGLEESDFIGLSLQNLLPTTVDTDPTTGHGLKNKLRHKKQSAIPVTQRIFSLSKSTQTLLILLQPEYDYPEKLSHQPDQSSVLDQLTTLFQPRRTQDLKQALMRLLSLSQDLLEADIVCLYKASGSHPQMDQYLSTNASLAEQLPSHLTSEDLAFITEATLWTSDDYPLNVLQKAAARIGFNTIVAVPFVDDHATFGLWVAAKINRIPDGNFFPLSRLLSAYAASFMEDQISLQNIRNLAYRLKQVVKIQSEIITNLDEGIIILMPDLTVAEINQAAEAMLGYANVEALRQPIDSILIGSESFSSAFSSAHEGFPTIMGGELSLHHRNGKSFPAQVLTLPVTNENKLVSIIMIIHDVSLMEKNQEEKKQLEQRAILGEVTAIFAHEVRNPLNAITLALQVIEENLPENDENLQWVGKIQEECNNLIQLMDSVLSFAKPLEYKLVRVDLAQLIRQILDRWHPRLLRLGISSYFETDVEIPLTLGDYRALEQVFTNLISNAANAMSNDGGYLSIKLSEAEPEESRSFYQINITDSGPGIPAEVHEQIFKPFVTGSKKGTGLGLAITQRIINAHKGKIEVESFPGGTIFKVFLAKQKGDLPQ